MPESIVPIINQDGELLVDSRLIAERLTISHEGFMRTVRKYETLIESRFGCIRFQLSYIQMPNGGNRQEVTHALLNENQATVLMTFSRNTDNVVQCKLDLVEAFSNAKKLLSEPVPLAPEPAIPALPSRVIALETAKSVFEIKDLLSDSDPRLCQMLVDVAINDAMAVIKAIAPSSETKWMGAVEIAESLKLPVTAKNRTTLGKFVKATCEELGKQEERICNGRMMPIWCYPMPNKDVEAAVRKFFG